MVAKYRPQNQTQNDFTLNCKTFVSSGLQQLLSTSFVYLNIFILNHKKLYVAWKITSVCEWLSATHFYFSIERRFLKHSSVYLHANE